MDKKRNLIIGLAVIFIVLLATFFVVKSRMKPQVEKETYLDIAKKTFEFVKSMETNTGIKEFQGCEEGNFRVDIADQFTPTVHLLLAYASMYDVTGDETLIPKIQELEEEIYYHLGYINRALVKSKNYDYSLKSYKIPGLHNESKDNKLIVYVYGSNIPNLFRTYYMLENKNLFSDEKLFEELLFGTSRQFINLFGVQDDSNFEYDPIPLFKIIGYVGTRNDIISKEEIVNIQKIFEGLESESPYCDLALSNYYLDIIQKKEIDESKYMSFLEDKSLNMNYLGEMDSCLQLSEELNMQTRKAKFETLSLNMISKIILEFSKPENCKYSNQFFVNGVASFPNRAFLSDNSNLIYHLTRNNFKSRVIQ